MEGNFDVCVDCDQTTEGGGVGTKGACGAGREGTAVGISRERGKGTRPEKFRAKENQLPSRQKQGQAD